MRTAARPAKPREIVDIIVPLDDAALKERNDSERRWSARGRERGNERRDRRLDPALFAGTAGRAATRRLTHVVAAPRTRNR